MMKTIKVSWEENSRKIDTVGTIVHCTPQKYVRLQIAGSSISIDLPWTGEFYEQDFCGRKYKCEI